MVGVRLTDMGGEGRISENKLPHMASLCLKRQKTKTGQTELEAFISFDMLYVF